MSEPSYLDRILEAKREALADNRFALPRPAQLTAELEALPKARDFIGALREGMRPRAIAEFKRASPSEGDIREEADPKHVAALYVDAGAACMSVLTDPHFRGSFEDLQRVRASVSIPLLCKDFILSRGQILHARRSGADAVLLICAALDPPLLRDLVRFAAEMGLAVLCEAHDEREVERSLAAGAMMIGVNARDLRTFEVDLEIHERLRSLVPPSRTYVAESGIKDRQDVERLRQLNVDAVLVGTQLMRADDPGIALMDLMSRA